MPFGTLLKCKLVNTIDSANLETPVIAVLPDCWTIFGGAQFINSSALGQYEDYLIDELVPYVDANYRTLSDREHRGVTGKSSGGYGSMVQAMRGYWSAHHRLRRITLYDFAADRRID